MSTAAKPSACRPVRGGRRDERGIQAHLGVRCPRLHHLLVDRALYVVRLLIFRLPNCLIFNAINHALHPFQCN